MIKAVKWTPDCLYMYPNGHIASGEKIKQDFPAVEYFTHILQITGDKVCGAVQELSAMRHHYGIDDALTEDEAIEALESLINAPVPEPDPTAEERIAAALEYQNLLSL